MPRYRNVFTRFLRQQQARVLADMENKLSRREVTRDGVDSLIDESMRGEDEEFKQSFREVQAFMYVQFGQAALEELLRDGTLFEVERPAVQQFLATDLAKRSDLINRTTAKELKRVLTEGVEQGESAVQLRQRITGLYGEMSKGRAQTIARTEVRRAQNLATVEGYRQGNATLKEWVSARDGNVRDSHQDADGQIVPLDAYFVVNGVQTDAPGSSGAPEEDINCRCVVAALASEEEAI